VTQGARAAAAPAPSDDHLKTLNLVDPIPAVVCYGELSKCKGRQRQFGPLSTRHSAESRRRQALAVID
jgi:hypothetical protein